MGRLVLVGAGRRQNELALLNPLEPTQLKSDFRIAC
jgi:hypothetical protein